MDYTRVHHSRRRAIVLGASRREDLHKFLTGGFKSQRTNSLGQHFAWNVMESNCHTRVFSFQLTEFEESRFCMTEIFSVL